MKKIQSKFTFFLTLLIFVLLFFSLPLITKAATLYFEPSTAEYGLGEIFIQEIRVNLEANEDINLVEIYLKYPNDILEVKDISFGNSIFSIIPHQPKIDQNKGIIHLAGGIIGGYKGILPGDPGKSNLLAKIIFLARFIGQGEINFLENSQILLNDGFGTPTKLSFNPARINILEKESLRNHWQEELSQDKIPPESFKPEIVKIDGKYYLIFFTTDKQTGVDYFEISETKNEKEKNWQKAESPYLLKDQSLKSYLFIKAVDRAGNERIVQIFPQKIFKWDGNYMVLFIIIVITGIFFLCLMMKFFKKFSLSQK